MPTARESVCWQEISNVKENIDEGSLCITESTIFKNMVVDRLNTTIILVTYT